MAKRFADLGIKLDNERKIFNREQVSITDILNTEIEVIDLLVRRKNKARRGSTPRSFQTYRHRGGGKVLHECRIAERCS